MSRYVDIPVSPILAAAARWRQLSLVQQRSLFKEDQLVWTTPVLEELERCYIHAPDSSKLSFFGKLKTQLAPASAEAKLLAVELAWALYLFPRKIISPATKVANLQVIADIGGVVLDKSHWALQIDVLSGIGSGGTFFNTGFWWEYSYAIYVFKAWAGLDLAEREALARDDADLVGWLDGLQLPERLPEGQLLSPQTRMFRHMFLYLLQPDRFERIASTDNKRNIVKALATKAGLSPDLSSPRAIDEQLLTIRRFFESQLDRMDLDFYLEPLHSMWSEVPRAAKAKEPEGAYSAGPGLTPDRGHWLVGAYWDDQDPADLTERFVSEGRWENGYTDRFLEVVKSIQPGDRIAIKTSYVQRLQLPFDNQGKSASCMRIKARGVVTSNPGDGRNLEVAWEKDFESFVIYHFTYRHTVSAIDQAKWPDVVRWIFEGVKQPLQAAAAHDAVIDDDRLSEVYGPAPRNVVFYGPPGTGKTRALLEDVLPAYTDEAVDEPEALRLQRLTGDLGWFEVIGAAMLQMGPGPITVPKLREHPYIQARLAQTASQDNVSQRLWGILQVHTALDCEAVATDKSKRVEPLVFSKSAKSEWSLVPGWEQLAPELKQAQESLGGKRAGGPASQKRYEMVTFHPNYAYEDFVEGLRPVRVEREGEDAVIEIRPVDGALKRLCARARKDPDRRYALVIDEINRGNVAKVFGELITLIEADKRIEVNAQGHATAGVQLRLPYTGDEFGVPKNVDFYGTMNTSDRSIALVDIALRRRFIFRELMPDASVIAGATQDGFIEADDDGEPINLRKLLRVLNARLTVLRGREATLGHAYFTSVKDMAGLRSAFRDRVIPLLQEHFFDDWGRIQQVLAVPKGAEPFLVSTRPEVSALFLGRSHDLEGLDELEVWRVSGELPASSFRALYEGVPDSALQF